MRGNGDNRPAEEQIKERQGDQVDRNVIPPTARKSPPGRVPQPDPRQVPGPVRSPGDALPR